ncbi:hypothetical protein SEUCBS139899_006750 [Sporothrix eucalyptigena]|uniref:RING-CH-type domain-containing protein n=1 Tax=Sporothrix eucalyptigena TaxID=1812306 RepID=A0ABP0CKB2_9PEZI
MVSSTDQPVTPPPIAADASCFICLQTPAETPDATWVTPCPCSLDAHEDCLLQWIAESEFKNGGARKKVRCPQCNARIRTVQPEDPLVSFQDRVTWWHRRASPPMLLGTIMTMGAAGSAFYGYQSMVVFAGEETTVFWLAGLADTRRPLWRQTLGFMGRLFALNMVAPVLLLQRVLPTLVNLLSLPPSMVYNLHLAWQVVRGDRVLLWPPSPSQILAAMPTVSIAYATAYHELFGKLERRLDNALRGRPATEAEEPQAPGPDAGHPAQDGQLVGVDVDADVAAPAPGLLGSLRRLGQAVAQLLGNDDDEHDHNGANLVIENVNAAAAFARDNEVQIQVEFVVEEEVIPGANEEDEWVDEVEGVDDDEILPPREVRDDDMDILGGGARDADIANGNGNDIDAALPPPDIPRVRPDVDVPFLPEAVPDVVPAAPPLAPAAAPAGGGAGAGGGGGLFLSDIVSAIVSQLMLPTMASAAGVVLKHVLPRSWVTSPEVTRPAGLGLYALMLPEKRRGLLRERWGRSLVGGMLVIVLRDLWALLIKYRRVQMKQQRRIRNVDRKRGQAETARVPSADGEAV